MKLTLSAEELNDIVTKALAKSIKAGTYVELRYLTSTKVTPDKDTPGNATLEITIDHVEVDIKTPQA